MKQPVEPSKEDCCNSGCNPCIFDVYEKQLRKYQIFLTQNELPVTTENGILQLEYTTFFVHNIYFICDSHKLITFKRLRQEKNKQPVQWNPGDHFLIKYCSDNTVCTRAYTPIKLKESCQDDFDFSIILKQYNSGIVSTYLFNLQKGDETLWRGPYGSYEKMPTKYNRIIMLAQGTGIAPFISIIDSILSDEDDMTKMFLAYCCPSIDVILFRNELYNFKSFWNFTYKVFLSSSSDHKNTKYQEPIVYGKLKCDDLVNLKPFTSNDQVLLCGCSDFMEEYKGFFKNEGLLLDNIILF
ncbi:NADH-cytochrome b5 reductase-like [Papilio machaon]|uniref:NADH-cytochrome b5 reductase-like n=1 Tax=Papilio machaon TaxID=76193 RepID=UPI001E6642A8|nr:NADH-cytochrome b5 reductase-like [Papilio machaon]